MRNDVEFMPSKHNDLVHISQLSCLFLFFIEKNAVSYIYLFVYSCGININNITT